jgi:hypothetical protein
VNSAIGRYVIRGQGGTAGGLEMWLSSGPSGQKKFKGSAQASLPRSIEEQ